MAIPAPLRLVFAGTPDFAAAHLHSLLASDHQLLAVYTQPDRPAGRGKKLRASPVKQLAESNQLPVFQPASLRQQDALDSLVALEPDLLVVVAYGLILPQAVLDVPRFGCINVHASLLPRWRGAAPIQRAIEAGDRRSGVTIMRMDAGLDTGDMLASAETPITDDMCAGELHDSLAELGSALLPQVLDDLRGHLERAQPQPQAGVSYAHKIEKSEARLDWTQDAETLARRVRAFNPFPVCWSLLGESRVKVWRASTCPAPGAAGEILSADESGIVVACNEGALRITELQLPGGRALPVKAVLNAQRELFAPGRCFTAAQDDP